MRRFFNILILGVFFSLTSLAQQDSLNIFTYEEYLSIVKKNHPVAVQADLRLRFGEANLMSSRGLFDPKVFSDVAQKYFDDKQYYSNLNGGLEVPTWFGIELNSGYEQNQGAFLNPENTTPGAGLWYAGISLPIGQGLFIDERRAELRKAQNFIDITETQRQLLLNDLLFNASLAYWEWSYYYNTMLVYEDALALANQRFEAVKSGAELGDNPFIDTLEAGIQVQNRLINLTQSQTNYKNSTLKLSVFLWDQGIIPLELGPNTFPLKLEDLDGVEVDPTYYNLKSNLVEIHPELIQYQLQIKQLEIDRRWSQEQLKPKLDLKYNAISEPIGGDPFQAYTTNNYTWGVTFGIPLLLRKERGKLEMAKIKIQDKELELNNANLKFENGINIAINEWQNSFDLIQIFKRTVRDYEDLLDGERTLFNTGESSLFMVNSRELGYINSRVKLLRYLADNREAKIKAEYIMGILWNQ